MLKSLLVERSYTNALSKEGEEEVYRTDSAAGDHISVSVAGRHIVLRCAYLPTAQNPMGGFFTAAVELEELIEALQQKEIKIHAIPFHP